MNPKSKFFKVYTGPGYPVDPKLEQERRDQEREAIVKESLTTELPEIDRKCIPFTTALEEYLAGMRN